MLIHKVWERNSIEPIRCRGEGCDAASSARDGMIIGRKAKIKKKDVSTKRKTEKEQDDEL